VIPPCSTTPDCDVLKKASNIARMPPDSFATMTGNIISGFTPPKTKASDSANTTAVRLREFLLDIAQFSMYIQIIYALRVGPMEFEWDENKRLSNIRKHKIDFIDAITIFDDFVYTFQDIRKDYGEPRFVSIGLLSDILISLVFTPRENKRRIISARMSRLQERKKYDDEREKITD
jgi:uncharacterized DUF497 family protein